MIQQLDKKFIQAMKTELNLSREKTLKELSRISQTNDSDPSKWQARFPNRGDADDENAQEVATFSDRLSLERTLKQFLKDIEQALVNIAQGRYGVCKHCAQVIQTARLKARPTSTSCIDCKKKLKGEN